MSIDKGLYELPQGLEAINDQEPAIEIEIEDPEAVNIAIDGLEIEMRHEEAEFDKNLAEDLDGQTLEMLASDLIGDVDADIS